VRVSVYKCNILFKINQHVEPLLFATTDIRNSRLGTEMNNLTYE
jgi:hypothetical protein